MAIGIYMANQIEPAKYEEAMGKLSAAGVGAPRGRTYHAAFFEGDTLSIFDVWDSMADFEAFGATMMPILEEVGITMAEPQISEIHSVVAA